MSTLTIQDSKSTPSDVAEQERRRFAVETARGNQRAEGIHVTPRLRALQERFIAGELSSEEVIAELKRPYQS